MLVVGFPVGALQANCYVLATGAGTECVVVDPGPGAESPVAKAVAEHRLRVAGILLTHGHFDHVQSAKGLAERHDVPVYVHPDDRDLLRDPLAGLSPELGTALGLRDWPGEPANVYEMDGTPLEFAGLRIEVDQVPGHTPGSVLFRLNSDQHGRIALTGDTVFAGSIGRTDLPGGDSVAMEKSLRDKVLELPDDTVLLPGHGPSSTVGRERASNPFLAGLR